MLSPASTSGVTSADLGCAGARSSGIRPMHGRWSEPRFAASTKGVHMRQRSIRAALVAGSLAAVALAPSAFAADATQTVLSIAGRRPGLGAVRDLHGESNRHDEPGDAADGQRAVQGAPASTPARRWRSRQVRRASPRARSRSARNSISAAFTGEAPFQASTATTLLMTVAKASVSVEEHGSRPILRSPARALTTWRA